MFQRRLIVLAMTVLVVVPAVPAVAQSLEDIRTVATGTVPPSGVPPVYWTAPSLLATYDNGPLVTHAGGGAGGADASRLQSVATTNTTLGFTASTAGAFRIADSFTVPPPGWIVNTITFFAYQTNSTTTSTFNTARVQIWNGAPNGGGAVVFGDTTTNRFLSTSFSNIYRDTETTAANNQRPIMATVATIGTTLAPGTYWVDFQLGGTLASGPFVPPLTVIGQANGCGGTCNAIQWNGTAWANLNDAGSLVQQDVKFIVDFTTTPVELQRFAAD